MSERWGVALISTAAFLLWCVAWTMLAALLLRRMARLAASTEWDGFQYLRERLRWALPAWTGLSGAVVALELMRGHWHGGPVELIVKGMMALLVVSLGAVAVETAFRLIGWELQRNKAAAPLVRFAQVGVAVLVFFITALFLLAVIDVTVTPLFALGAIALAPVFLLFQDTITNVVSYFRLMVGGRLRVGDLVHLENGVAGHVEEITWHDVRIRTRANNLLSVPNRRLARLMVTNYHLPDPGTLCSTPVVVNGSAEPETVQAVLQDELQRAGQELPGVEVDSSDCVRPESQRKDQGTAFVLLYRVADPDFREDLERDILQRVGRRFRQEGIDSPLLEMVPRSGTREPLPTSAQELRLLVKDRLSNDMFIVASNREPYVHNFDGTSVRWTKPVSGMTTAMDPVMSVLGGVWVAHGSGSADRRISGAEGRVEVPPDDGKYTLRRVWLSKEEEEGYYYGFSNQALWPLCHVVYVRPHFEAAQWKVYREVNEKFANVIVQEARGRRVFVFLQDYHLALVPRLLRGSGTPVTLAHFWHVPWPNAEVFRTCPWGDQILEGLLGNDMIGFHHPQYCNNFLRSVDATLESRVDYDRQTVTRGGRETRVRAFPIGVDFAEISGGATTPRVERLRAQFRRSLGLEGCRMGLGVDRLDYTKGIPERLKALDRFFARYPEFLGRFTFVQVGVPSRSYVPEYRKVEDDVQHLVEEVNWRHQQGSWKPVVYLKRSFESASLWALYSLADMCIVSPLHDGLNLVAKEYVASRVGNNGVLVLSRFAGAAEELSGALDVNPYDTEMFADAIKQGLELSPEEQSRRMSRMRVQVEENDIYRWAARLLSQFSQIDTSQAETRSQSPLTVGR